MKRITHRSEVLLIFSWAGDIKRSSTSKSIKSGKVTYVNPSFQNFLETNLCNDCKKKRKRGCLMIKDLLDCMFTNHREKVLVDQIINTSECLIQEYEEHFRGLKKREDFADAFENWLTKITSKNDNSDADVDIFTNLFTQNRRKIPILGIKTKKIGGIGFTKPESNENIFFDVFCVFHTSKDNTKITGYQGVFIPSDRVKNYYIQLNTQLNRNAITRVMARNQSHNVGSHVLSRLTQENDIATILSHSPYTPLFRSELTDNKFIATFLSYLKNRQEFLADVVSGTPQIQTSKSFINDLLRGIDDNRILLDRISGVGEDFKYKFDPKGKVKIEKGENETKITDVQVAISNDVLGQQAFYIIIENIVRNTAKHSPCQNEKGCVFTFKVNDCKLDNAYYEVIIYDDSPTDKAEDTIQKLNELINRPILDESTQDLRQQGLGLIEMQTCAAYLCKIDIADIEKEEFNTETDSGQLKILKAVKVNKDGDEVKETDEKYYLGYRLYLPKSKELLIINRKGDLWRDCEEKDLKALESSGIQLLNVDNGWKPKEVYPHAIMLIKGEVTGLVDNPKLPHRWVSYEEVEECFEQYEKEFEPDEYDYEISKHITAIIPEVWRAYIHKKKISNKIKDFDFDELNFLTPKIESGINYCITFSHHGQGVTIHAKKWDKEGGDRNYTAIFRSQDQPLLSIDSDVQLEKIFGNKNNLTPIFKEADACLTNIFILDERIQELSNKNEYQCEGATRVSYRDIWNMMHVFIPKAEEDINLNAQTFDPEYQTKIQDLICSEFGSESQRQKKGLDYIIIHLGVIEKILAAKDGKSKDSQNDIEELLNYLRQTLEPHAKIIITSGRAPQNIPDGIYFLSYAMLSQYVIERLSKPLLNELICSSRPKN